MPDFDELRAQRRQAFQYLQREGTNLAFGLAGSGKGAKATGAILGQNALGENRASRIIGAKEKNIEHAVWLICLRHGERLF
ncbi:MAG: hypothetical protein K5821_13210 [Nitrobacter sp.]|nr:hypothetical protein [Nitrobacter sp.]MCV0387367.1 hypothetical protein [Nitrobacter sp.]